MFRVVKQNNSYTLTNEVMNFGPFADECSLTSEITNKNIKVLYEPKDLIFDVTASSTSGTIVYLATKYGSDLHNLDHTNVMGLPEFFGRANMKCTWILDKNTSIMAIRKMLENLGFTYDATLD